MVGQGGRFLLPLVLVEECRDRFPIDCNRSPPLRRWRIWRRLPSVGRLRYTCRGTSLRGAERIELEHLNTLIFQPGAFRRESTPQVSETRPVRNRQ